MITINYAGNSEEYKEGTRYLDIARLHQPEYKEDIVLASVNGKLQELWKSIKENDKISFLTTADALGMNTYRRSALFLMLKAFHDVFEEKGINNSVFVDFSLSKGLFCRCSDNRKVSLQEIQLVEKRMHELADENIPINKYSVGTQTAVERFHKHGMLDKERLFRYRRVSKVNLYKINDFEDYFYGYMVPSTGYIKNFKIYPYDNGFVLQLPVKEAPGQIPEFRPQNKLYATLRESSLWGEELGIRNVGELNDLVTGRNKTVCTDFNELILVQEALMEKRMAQIADTVAKNKDIKFIMIAGPSSSGKTTFSRRLSVQLKAAGLMPHPISVDNYFVDRENSPRDEFGNYNYEDLECLDVKCFNDDMQRALTGETIELPTYNFKSGHREYKGNTITLGPDDILVIEGIHCLNERLYPSLPKENIFKIYISALTQLNVDEHNRIPTTDGRLIRRMIRDARTRGASAKDTIAMWESVRKGEEKNIFPYQESADVVFNSALIYELAVLKQYAEPLLFGIEKDEPEYIEAKRLLKFFDYFVGINADDIPKNSILREFIGGSCFDV